MGVVTGVVCEILWYPKLYTVIISKEVTLLYIKLVLV